MALQEEPELWFDVTVFLDALVAGQANSFVIPPEFYLRFGTALGARLTFEVTAMGPSAALANKVKIELEATGALTDRSDLFQSYWNTTAIVRGTQTVAYNLGGGGGEQQGYPRGVTRCRLTNLDNTLGNWASVRVRAWRQLAQP